MNALRRWTFLCGLTAALVCATSPGLQAQAANTAALAAQIGQAMTRGDLSAAERLLTEGLRTEPALEELLVLRADLYVRQGKLSAALNQVHTLRERNPSNPTYRLREAQYLSWLGRVRSGSEAYESLLKDYPQDHDARTGLGLTLYWRGDFDGARREFAQVLKAQPDNALAFNSDLQAQIALGQTSDAYGAASARDRSTGETDAELGLVLATIIARVDADELAEQLASRPTTDPDLQRRQTTFRAHRLIARGYHEGGLQLVRPFAESHPQDYNTLVDSADAHAAADQRTVAREYYERAVALSPERYEARLGLARLATREGRVNGSLEILQSLVKQNPEAVECWFAIARAALLTEDFPRARTALETLERIAPKSALLHEEKIRLALAQGDVAGYEECLGKFQADQPSSVSAFLWEQRWRYIQSKPLDVQALISRVDLLSPESSSQILRLLPHSDIKSATAIRKMLPPAPAPELEALTRGALARHLALVLQKAPALALAGDAADAERVWIEILANGWWAYVNTPFAYHEKSAGDSDFGPVVVWRAGELQRRLRTLQAETEGPLFDDWLMARAHWFRQWNGRWNSPAALEALAKAMSELVSDSRTVTPAQIREAWQASEKPLQASDDSFAALVLRARWRELRFDYAEAIELWQQIESKYPLAAEPARRHAAVLVAAGRWREAEKLYQRHTTVRPVAPQVRLEYADLLRRQGNETEAFRQYQTLADEGFAEPELFLGLATLADMHWDKQKAAQWIEQGLERNPNAPSLRAAQAQQFLKNNQRQKLAELISAGDVPSWLDEELLAAARPALSPARQQAVLNSPQWWLSWRWLPSQKLAHYSRAVAPPSHDEFGITAGYEFSALQDTSGSGIHRPDWHEAFVSFSWRRTARQTLFLDYHRYERFGSSADQVNLAVAGGWTRDWGLRLSSGAALSGNFIPDWRIGAGATHRFNDRLFADLDFNYLAFTGVDVRQMVPGATWHWCPRFSSEARIYISQSELNTGASSWNSTYYVSTSWEFKAQSWVKAHYSIGDENSANLNRNLIGEGAFYSAGAELRLAWRHGWAIQPSYRFERHSQFHLHAIGLSLQSRF